MRLSAFQLRRLATLLGLAWLTLANGAFSCSPEVKQLGKTGLNPTPTSTSTGTNNFTLNFATRTLVTDSTVYAQGGTMSAAAIQGGCGATGTSCVCDFFTDANGSGKVSSTAGATTLNTSGNFLTCTIPSSPSSYTHMRIRDNSGIRVSNTVEITLQSALTLTKILGDLPANETRKIYEYRCYINYLHKPGTTTTSFSCTPNGALSVIQVPYHFYLYADNLTNNFSSRIPDVLHTGTTGTLCGALIKFIDCTTAHDGTTNPNDVTLKFGIYARNAGAFTVPVQLANAPGRMQGFTTVYGYAAKYDSTTGTCPPGLERRTVYKQTPNAVSDSSLNSTLVDTRINTAATSFNMLVDQFTGGTCASGTCTSPALNRDSATPTNLQTAAYVAQTGTTDDFCVLPTSLLSGI